jgi:hypothetical protein
MTLLGGEWKPMAAGSAAHTELMQSTVALFRYSEFYYYLLYF